MNNRTAENPLKRSARITGILYLSLVVLGPFSMLYVPSVLIVPGNTAATAANAAASGGLLRLGMAGDALIFLIEIMLTALLYILLKQVDQTISLAAAFSRLAMTVIQGANLLNYFYVLLLAGGAGTLAGLGSEQSSGLMMLFFNAHESAALIWGLFFGLHLCLLGTLVYKSGYLPRLVGILLAVAGVCYLTQSFGNILFPQFKAVFSTIGLLSMVEIAFPLWLVIKGVKDPQVVIEAPVE
ncbi:MAG: DUF4386 domain-containing protein [Anaerolineaceae bacterium]